MSAPDTAPVADKQSVRVLAAAIGQREAARRLGMSENTVKSICYRAGDAATLSATTDSRIQPMHPNAPIEAIKDVNAENGARSRSAALRYSARNLEHLADLSPEEGVLLAPQAASLVKVASTAGEWATASRGAVRINILAADPFALQVIEG